MIEFIALFWLISGLFVVVGVLTMRNRDVAGILVSGWSDKFWIIVGLIILTIVLGSFVVIYWQYSAVSVSQ